jgi:hypothetical protein
MTNIATAEPVEYVPLAGCETMMASDIDEVMENPTIVIV